MKFLTSIFWLCAVAMLCTSGRAAAGDKEFEDLASEYIENLLQMNPEQATNLGDHRFDGRLGDRSLEGVRKRMAINKEYLKRLAKISPESLSKQNHIDHKILRSNLERVIFQDEELRPYEWDPRVYNVGGAIYDLVARDFAPLDVRMRSAMERLRAVPGLLEQAKKNLERPPRIHTETAILQNKGNINLIRAELEPFVEQVPSIGEELKPVRDRAIEALEAYGEWLEKDLLPRSDGDFRIGDERWRKKLALTLESDLSKEEILEAATADLKATQSAMYETALPLYRKFFPDVTDESKLKDVKHVNKAVLDKLAETRPTNETIVERSRKSLEEATRFVRMHGLVTVPDEPVEIIVMPEFKRGVAVAYCDAPGPLEKELKTFFAISPTPEDWSEERVESFFKEYNDYMVHDLTIHEAMPGHYLQLTHANRFEAPTMIRAIFSSGPFIEGWAVYSEAVMAEAGYGGPEVRMQQLKMRLRVIINAIIDQKIHTEGMGEEAAMALMMDEGFQEEGEAAGKWRRACLTSVQLSTYFVGMVEVRKIRDAYEVRHGVDFDRKKFHDEMLSYGSPAPKYVKELMGL